MKYLALPAAGPVPGGERTGEKVPQGALCAAKGGAFAAALLPAEDDVGPCPCGTRRASKKPRAPAARVRGFFSNGFGGQKRKDQGVQGLIALSPEKVLSDRSRWAAERRIGAERPKPLFLGANWGRALMVRLSCKAASKAQAWARRAQCVDHALDDRGLEAGCYGSRSPAGGARSRRAISIFLAVSK